MLTSARGAEAPPGPAAYVAAVGVFALAVVLFWPVTGHEFLNFDTPSYVAANPNVANGLSWPGLLWALTAFEVSNWHPVTWWSHMLDVTLFGLDAGAHHGMSVALHGLNGVLLFAYLTRWAGHWPAALVVALLFVAHPMHVESVAWVAERKDLLSTGFLLLAMHAHAAWAGAPPRTGARAFRYVLLVSLLGLGLMSKAMLVTAPFILLLLDYWPLGRIRDGNWREAAADVARLALEKVPLLLLVVVVIALTLYAQAGTAMAAGANVPLIDRLANAVVALDHYLRSAIWPADLALFHPHPGSRSLGEVLPALLLPLVAANVALALVRRVPAVFVGTAVFAGSLVPVLGIVQVGAQAYADRYTYVPYIGLFVAAVYGALALPGWRASRWLPGAWAALVLVATIACVIQTRAYLQHWKNSTTIWTYTLRKVDPEYARIAAGEAPLAETRLRALFNPWFKLGLAHAVEERHVPAAYHFAEATRLDPEHAETWYRLGWALLRSGATETALYAFGRFLELGPDNPAARAEVEALRARYATQ